MGYFQLQRKDGVERTMGMSVMGCGPITAVKERRKCTLVTIVVNRAKYQSERVLLGKENRAC